MYIMKGKMFVYKYKAVHNASFHEDELDESNLLRMSTISNMTFNACFYY